MIAPPPYRGRFAPSPTGPLHFGSLVAALGSYLQARSQGGEWLIRIEDIDPPREVAGAKAGILRTLERLRLCWDGTVVYQSQRLASYDEALEQLAAKGVLYGCTCTRRDLTNLGKRGPHGWIYPGTCRRQAHQRSDSLALRVRTHERPIGFHDALQGTQSQVIEREVGDFVVKRADGLIAYQLAVVIDDARQGITEVVRGSDLLDSTPRQIHLQHLLALPTPDYLHLPLALDPRGRKWTKKHGAQPVNPKKCGPEITLALSFRNHRPPRDLQNAPPGELLEWGIVNWQSSRLPPVPGIPLLQPETTTQR